MRVLHVSELSSVSGGFININIFNYLTEQHSPLTIHCFTALIGFIFGGASTLFEHYSGRYT